MYTRIRQVLTYTYLSLQVLISIGLILNNQYALLFNPLLTSLFYLALLLLERFTSFRTGNHVRALLIIVLTSHNFFGEYLNWYMQTKFFDKALHLLGTCTFTLLGYELLRAFIPLNSPKPKILAFTLAVLIGTSLGTGFELLEFLLDMVAQNHNQHGLLDTDWDLVFDLLGAILAGVLVAQRRAH